MNLPPLRGSSEIRMDTDQSEGLFFKQRQARATNNTMAPCSVVVGLDVLEQGAIQIVAQCEPDAVNCVDLQSVEEALGHGVVVATMTFVG